jgi:hypothetical protein
MERGADKILLTLVSKLVFPTIKLIGNIHCKIHYTSRTSHIQEADQILAVEL